MEKESYCDFGCCHGSKYPHPESSSSFLHCLDLPLKASSHSIAMKWFRTKFRACAWGDSASQAAVLHPRALSRLWDRQEPRVALPSPLGTAAPASGQAQFCLQRDTGRKVFFSVSKTILLLSRASPAPPCHRHCSLLVVRDETTDNTLVDKIGKTFLVIWFYRVQSFKQPKYGTGEW